ncbi:MAG: hypothetical protein CLLPBCKN_007096 [Chroococcidiopsis cubana SAG 39.79]|uniref:hypothetical protein n=1 Tax=Chroococcidiopsis cubana TaxID=171392 RepID=UPI000F8D3946|nr:hypothetical protein [Chroococcidiopsis cubana]MDZ4877661.1 hypothetical protein [Chroococcidiopsis cubana SAG 39.79]
MKRTMTAIFIGTMLSFISFILPATATATSKEAKSMPNLLPEHLTGDMKREAISFIKQLRSDRLLRDAHPVRIAKCLTRRAHRGRFTCL